MYQLSDCLSKIIFDVVDNDELDAMIDISIKTWPYSILTIAMINEKQRRNLEECILE